MELVVRVPVNETLERLGHGARWVQNTTRTRRGAACLHAALREFEYVQGDARLIEQVADQQGWGPAFNDDPSTVFADVERVLRRHHVITAGELAETFGPSWSLVVSVVRRAATIDPVSLTAVAVDRQAMRVAAQAGQVAARDHDRSTCRAADAASGVVGAVLPGVAAVAARTVAAVSLRDLVDRSEFTSTHYETLTSAWRSVFPGFDEGADLLPTAGPEPVVPVDNVVELFPEVGCRRVVAA